MWTVLCGLPAGTPAPASAAVHEPPSDGDSLTVYLMTIGTGDPVWERFGHNALWIHNDDTGQDVVWNWGLFSFSQAGFLPRLVRGEMLYGMGGLDLAASLAEYRATGRPVWIQELALTPEQEIELDRLVRVNARPDNRLYRYDYYRDNCSTRVRDALDTVLGGQIRATFAERPAGVTWRWHTLRLLRDTPLLRAGVQLVLGQPGDEAISAYEEMFLPLRLRAHLATLEVESPDGSLRPLVIREEQVLASPRAPAPDAPESRVWTYLLVGLLVSGLVSGLVFRAREAGRAVSVGAGLSLAVWGLFAGLIGLILVAAHLTDHTFWYRNENLLQTNPLSIALVAGGLGFALRGRIAPWAARVAQIVAVLSILGLLLKVLPAFGQENMEIIALALPVNVGVAWSLRRLSMPTA